MTEWHASDYHLRSSLQQAMAAEQLGRLTLIGSERILDVGCGDGRITAEMAARVPGGSVLGIDPSRAMIAFATGHYGPPDHPNLHFEVADVRHLPFRHEFDLVVSFNALHWVPEQKAALASIRRALTPGGRALLRLVPESDRPSLEDVIEQVRQRPCWAAHFPGFVRPFAHFTPHAYHALAEAAGFRVDQLLVEDKAWDFQTREAFLAFCRATFVEWTQHLPQDQWEAFITDVLDRYQALAADNPQEANTFKFCQMTAELTTAPAPDASRPGSSRAG